MGHLPQLVRVVSRWSAAAGVDLAVFAGCWWAWETLQLPPSGSDRLGVALAVAAAVSAASGGPLYWWAGREKPNGHRGRAKPVRWQVPTAADWVEREELTEVVSALTAAGTDTVALTTGLVGAGGFGKTTLAARACQDRAVRRRFRGGIVWVTVGRGLRGAELAAKISDACGSLVSVTTALPSPASVGARITPRISTWQERTTLKGQTALNGHTRAVAAVAVSYLSAVSGFVTADGLATTGAWSARACLAAASCACPLAGGGRPRPRAGGGRPRRRQTAARRLRRPGR